MGLGSNFPQPSRLTDGSRSLLSSPSAALSLPSVSDKFTPSSLTYSVVSIMCKKRPPNRRFNVVTRPRTSAAKFGPPFTTTTEPGFANPAQLSAATAPTRCFFYQTGSLTPSAAAEPSRRLSAEPWVFSAQAAGNRRRSSDREWNPTRLSHLSADD